MCLATGDDEGLGLGLRAVDLRVPGVSAVSERSESFKDHFSQATLFGNSLTDDERDRIVSATHFELGKVDSFEVRHRVVHEIFNHADHDLAVRCA